MMRLEAKHTFATEPTDLVFANVASQQASQQRVVYSASFCQALAESIGRCILNKKVKQVERLDPDLVGSTSSLAMSQQIECIAIEMLMGYLVCQCWWGDLFWVSLFRTWTVHDGLRVAVISTKHPSCDAILFGPKLPLQQAENSWTHDIAWCL